MDSRSHVEFALRLLPTHLKSAALTSLFPQIDRRPATLHRNYAHHLNKARDLTRIGWSSLSGGDSGAVASKFATPAEAAYVDLRFSEERERITAYLKTDIPSSMSEEFATAAEMAFVSHLYLDTFNQPVQAFVPGKSTVSGQFPLWDKVGDFRYRLYVEGVVEELRADWLKSSIWNTKFECREMTHAMVVRLAQLAGHDDPTFISAALAKSGFAGLPPADQAVRWLLDMEHELCALHMKYLG